MLSFPKIYVQGVETDSIKLSFNVSYGVYL